MHRLAEALRTSIARHDILRSSVLWQGLLEPVQVVWRAAPLALEQLALAPENGPVARQLRERWGGSRCRLDLGQAPLMRLVYAHDPATRRWIALWQRHHLIVDHISEHVLQAELGAILQGRSAGLAVLVPYRNFVAQARLGLGEHEHRRFFLGMLGDVDASAAPDSLQEQSRSPAGSVGFFKLRERERPGAPRTQRLLAACAGAPVSAPQA